jgi:hypothetical protein
MTHTNGGGTNGDGGSGGGSAAAQQYQLLGLIQANFKATPPQVSPFGTTTLSWNAQIPRTLRVPVTLIFEGQPVNHADSRAVTVPATTQFYLSAKTNLTSRVISTLTVQVDTAQCSATVTPESIVKQTILDKVKPFIPVGGQISVHGAGVAVKMDVATLSIIIPLTITADGDHPTLDINMSFFVGMSNTPNTIEVAPLNVDVALHLHGLGGLFCEGFGHDLSVAFLNVIAELVAPMIADGLTAQVKSACLTAQQQDIPNHRTFELTSFVWDDTQFAFTICPKGSGTGAIPRRAIESEDVKPKSSSESHIPKTSHRETRKPQKAKSKRG